LHLLHFFAAALRGVDNDEFVLLTVTGGKDTDVQDDGVTDIQPTDNLGTLHALVTVYELNAGGIEISVITDIAWHYARNLIGKVISKELEIRLSDLARTFFKEDINGDGLIDAKDLLAFSPSNLQHKSKLNFNYEVLFSEDSNGNSIIRCYHRNLQEDLESMLEKTFGSRLSLHAAPDSRYKSVKVEATLFGRGDIKSDIGGIDYDSDRSSNANVNHSFFDRDPLKTITLTATPKADTEILGWDGCDVISSNNTQCQVNLEKNRQVVASFGYKETEVVANLIDLSRANTSLEDMKVYVTVNHGDDDLVDLISGIIEGDYVVGSAGSGFLREVVEIEVISDYKYVLTTVDASLEDIIKQGTGTLSKQMTYQDLAGDISNQQQVSGLNMVSAKSVATASTPGDTLSAPSAFEGIDGIQLVPSEDPNSNVFVIRMGESDFENTNGLSEKTDISCTNGSCNGSIVILEKDDGTPLITGNGEVSVTITYDVGISYGLFSGFEYFKFIPKVVITEQMEVIFEDEVNATPDPVKLGTISFGKMSFFIGPVPVWI